MVNPDYILPEELRGKTIPGTNIDVPKKTYALSVEYVWQSKSKARSAVVFYEEVVDEKTKKKTGEIRAFDANEFSNTEDSLKEIVEEGLREFQEKLAQGKVN
jgi:ribosomal protein L4